MQSANALSGRACLTLCKEESLFELPLVTAALTAHAASATVMQCHGSEHFARLNM